MKNKKIMIIVAIALMGSTLLPTTAMAMEMKNNTNKNKVVLAQNNTVNRPTGNRLESTSPVTVYNKVNINNNKIIVSNSTNVPVFNVGFNSETHEITSYAYPKGNNYTGIFNGKDFKMNLINSSGNIIQSFDGNTQQDATEIVQEINGTTYTDGDILEIETNAKFAPSEVKAGKKVLNNNFNKEYYKITENGLVAIGDKFVNYSGLDVLGDSNFNGEFKITGKINPNEDVTVAVNGKNFIAKSDSEGNYTLNLTGLKNVSETTEFVFSANGYINTIAYPTINNNINLQHSFINFYDNSQNQSNISFSIGFDPATNKIVSNLNPNIWLNQSNIGIKIINSDGKTTFNTDFNEGYTNNIAGIPYALNGMSYKYGDIIGISYAKNGSIPTISNGNDVMGNVNGEMEYFEMTKQGLVPVKVGNFALTNSLTIDGNILAANISLAKGQTESNINSSKELVALDSKGNIISEGSAIGAGSKNLTGTLSLSSLKNGESYELGLKVGNTIYKVLDNSNIYGNSSYSVEGNSNNIVTLSQKATPMVQINSINDIENYYKTLETNLNSEVTSSNINNISDLIQNQSTSYNFIKCAGINNLNSIYNMKNGKEFINWLLNNTQAMKYFIEGTSLGNINLTQLTILYNIYNTYTNSRWGFNLKLAVATAIVEPQYINNPIAPSWPFENGGNPVERYNIFEKLNAEGAMLPIFNTANIKYLEGVVRTIIPNSQILAARDVMLENHNVLVNEGQLINAQWDLNYNKINPYNGIDIFNNGFYGNNPSIYTVWRDGGVCGAISKLTTVTANSFGIPAIIVGQPGHCAFEYDNQGNWELGYNIYGWQQSVAGDLSGWSNDIATSGIVSNYDLLYNDAIKKGTLEQSNDYVALVNTLTNYNLKLEAINKAISINSLNLKAYLAKINLYKSNSNVTAAEYAQLANTIMTNLKAYPMPMFDLLNQIQKQLLQLNSQTEYNKIVEALSSTLNEVKNESKSEGQPQIAQNMINQMASHGFKENEPKNQGEIYLNDWETNNALNINFVNGKINVTGQHKWIGTSNNDYLEVDIYDANGKIIKSVKATGEEFCANQYGDDFADLLNGSAYSVGDYIKVTYKTGKASNSTLGFISSDMKNEKLGVSSTFEVTKNGLVLYNKNKETLKSEIKELQTEINKGTNLIDNLGYTQSSEYNLYTVMQNAQAVLNNKKSTMQNVSDEVNKMEKAIKDLVLNESGLQSYINIAKEYVNNNKYTETSRNNLEAAILSGEKVIANKNATATQVWNAMNLINSSYKNLIINKETLKSDKEELQTEMNKGTNLINEVLGYTQNSEYNLFEIIQNAQTVLNNKNSSVEDISNEIDKVKEGIKDLVLNKSGLQSYINASKECINNTQYTKESRDNLEAAILAGEKVIANKNATAAEIWNSMDSINNYYEKLVINK